MTHPLLAPRLLGLHLLGVVAVGAALWLGLWQYDAWQAGRSDEAAQRVDTAPLPLRDVLGPDEAFTNDTVGQPVDLEGRWLPEATFLVGDRELDGRSGVWAVTPVAVCGTDEDCTSAPAMLVVRGWAAAADEVPDPPTGRVEVTGWLQPGEGSGAPDPDPGDDVLPELRLADAVQRVDQDLYGGYVAAETVSTAPGGTEPGLAAVTPSSLPEVGALTSVRNLLYAVEWWLFGAFAVLVWWRWCRDEVSRVTGVPSPV